ncbi:hypothetical protein HBI14_111540 [Parastagonospora nodorum]|nr:hypothetical protein HBI14_111540 [Parastagonospora nodorum]
MQTSKYAPKTPAESLAQSRAEKLRQEKDNSTRLFGRLRWKAEMLMVSYYKALEIVRAASSSTDPISKQAETMFKVDFFEFYTLLERYITTCLSIVGVKVSGAAPQTNINALRYITNPDLHRSRPLASHAFHANLLDALDDENCPLHASFGVHDVRVELGLAKDFRNAWKDADGRIIASKWDDDASRKKNITLQDSQLETMLRALLAGCDHAHGVVQQFSGAPLNGFSSRDFEPQPQSYNTTSSDDTPLEYMDDAMELD